MPRLRQVPAPKRRRRPSPCTTSSSATATRSPSPAPRPARRATGGRCSPTRPTCSSTPCRGFALYASPERKLDPKLRELGQTRAGWLVGSQFVFSQHCKSCRALGLHRGEDRGAQVVAGLRPASLRSSGRCSPTPTPRARFGRVDDAVFDALRGRPQRRADPRVHVHHDDCTTMHAVMLARAAPRVRRPRRPDRRDRGTDGRGVARHHARHQRCTGRVRRVEARDDDDGRVARRHVRHSAGRVSAPMADPRDPQPEPRHDRHRGQLAQRRLAHDPARARRVAAPSCSGSSTRTRSCSPDFSYRRARWATGSDARVRSSAAS